MSHYNLLDLLVKNLILVITIIFSLWAGLAIHVSQDIISTVFIDLDFYGNENDSKSSCTNSKVQPESSEHNKKRKRTKSSLQEQPAHGGLEVEMSDNLTPISVKIAALEALEALLTVVCSSDDNPKQV